MVNMCMNKIEFAADSLLRYICHCPLFCADILHIFEISLFLRTLSSKNFLFFLNNLGILFCGCQEETNDCLGFADL